jgi:hypothetical protein
VAVSPPEGPRPPQAARKAVPTALPAAVIRNLRREVDAMGEEIGMDVRDIAADAGMALAGGGKGGWSRVRACGRATGLRNEVRRLEVMKPARQADRRP